MQRLHKLRMRLPASQIDWMKIRQQRDAMSYLGCAGDRQQIGNFSERLYALKSIKSLPAVDAEIRGDLDFCSDRAMRPKINRGARLAGCDLCP
jgi:hypothetical protein